jgi:hypothetical protein
MKANEDNFPWLSHAIQECHLIVHYDPCIKLNTFREVETMLPKLSTINVIDFHLVFPGNKLTRQFKPLSSKELCWLILSVHVVFYLPIRNWLDTDSNTLWYSSHTVFSRKSFHGLGSSLGEAQPSWTSKKETDFLQHCILNRHNSLELTA